LRDSLDYEPKAPYAFTGTVTEVVFDLKPAASHDDEKALHETAQHHNLAHGVAA
jgi:arylsulfatase